MYGILTGSIIISLLHALIPNHWLPVIAVGRRERWTLKEVTTVTLIAALAHALSTVVLGILLALLGKGLNGQVNRFMHWVAPLILIIMGLIFSYRHHKHKHFHITDEVKRRHTKKRIIAALAVAMFFSPCMEIEAYFLLAGAQAPWVLWCMTLLYTVITTGGMLLLVRYAYMGLLKLNWHTLEHNAGIITGVTLIATGIITFFIS